MILPCNTDEHLTKFIHFEQNTKIIHDANTRHNVYGSDSDLILSGLALHEPYFTIMREDSQHNRSLATMSNNIESKYISVHLSTLREYLDYELGIPNLSSFPWNLDRAIDN